MLTGILKGTVLCCDGENSTWNSIFNTDRNILNETTSLLRIIYRIIIPIIVISGIFGNTLIFLVLSTPMFRGIAYLYLRGLTLAHIGVLLSWIPVFIRLGYGMKNNYPSVFYHAHLELVAVNTFAIATILIMTCLIVDRYIFIFFPARIRSRNARKNVHSFTLCSFILGFAISAPLTGMRIVYEQQESTETVFTLRENTSITRTALWNTYIWIMEITLRLCPTIILLLLNSFVVKRFLQLNAKKREFQSVSEKFRTPNVPETSLLTRNRGYREEQHLAILMSMMTICFIITMIPSILTEFIYHDYYETKGNGYLLFRAFAAVTELCNFAIHIITYFLCSKEFRTEFLKILRNRCRKNIAEEDFERPIGEIEDYSRHGTTVRLTPEQTKLNSPASASKLNPMEEDKESEILNASDIV
ncbi:PREDICTED: probable G-protein coupled receptor B0563.6 [Eufriesea mexicana]|uniref:probable G-protein coupled receptor B0563.6 n=1 Tax=Eufriesea mexicana TaxID=516756 RepID=UPI00083C5AD0|nr:PREDICTED: probable G-protein coupled receptor B0563.6 [Eufriesea mexicana]